MIKAKASRLVGSLRLPLLFIALSFFGPLRGLAQETNDSIYQDLEGIEVTGSSFGRLEKGGGMELSGLQIMDGVHVLGEADALRVISRLSGVVTQGDYGSGLMIDGHLPSHVLYRIDDVPVFFPYRFGGIFSTFNMGHFKSVAFERGIHSAEMPSRLGAKIDFKTPRISRGTVSGSANIGLISSSLSIHAPVGSRFSLSASARVSYLDKIYGRFLEKVDNSVSYNFQDFNLTGAYDVSGNDCLSLNAFYSSDRLTYRDDNYAMDTRMGWRNASGSLSWSRTGRLSMAHRLFASYFSNTLTLAMPQFALSVPSSILQCGASGSFSFPPLNGESVSLDAGYELNWFSNRVQQVDIYDSNIRDRSDARPLNAFETRLYADAKFRLPHGLELKTGVSTLLFFNGNYVDGSADPRLTLTLPLAPGELSVHLGSYSQFLHQVGFSQMGLASDFWIVSGKGLKPERSLNIELDYTGFLSPASLYFSVNVYGKRFFKLAEYMGELLSIIDDEFRAEDLIVSSNGYAAGVNLQVRKNFGRFTGSVGAGYGIARLRMPGFARFVRARSETGFTFDAELKYNFNSHWSMGGNFRFASGRPYTPVNALYFISGNLMKEYGVPNSALLPAWHRLDLSATWQTVTETISFRLTHMVNISIINVYGRKNPEFLTYTLDLKKGMVALKTVASLYRFLPSVSYSIIF